MFKFNLKLSLIYSLVIFLQLSLISEYIYQTLS